jgi:hypothetical protein
LLSFVNFHACQLDISPQGTAKRARLITALRDGIKLYRSYAVEKK